MRNWWKSFWHGRRKPDTWCAEPSRLDWLWLRDWDQGKHRVARVLVGWYR